MNFFDTQVMPFLVKKQQEGKIRNIPKVSPQSPLQDKVAKVFDDFGGINGKNLIEKWDLYKIYEMKESNKKIFSVDTPPPTVSGNLHIGHVFSYTHTDFIVRYKRITGYEIFYPIVTID